MNVVVLQGRLTKDVELRYTAENQLAVATFTLAVDRFGKERETDFIRVTVFGKQAKNAERYIGKGSRAGVKGSIRTGSYTNKDGKTVYTTDVIADQVAFIDFKDQEKPEEKSVEIEPQSDGFSAIDEVVPF